MNSIHITDARRILDKGQPVSLTVIKKDGSLMEVADAVSLRYNFRAGTRTIKLLASRQLRTIRDVMIIRINDLEVYL